jgi:hypothetical protein
MTGAARGLFSRARPVVVDDIWVSRMSDKPGDFFLGVIDFFGIVVPGFALLVLQGPTLSRLAGISLPQTGNWWAWAAAFVVAYVAGHFLLGLGVPLNRLAAAVFPEASDLYFQDVRNQVPLPLNAPRSRSNVFNAAFSFIRIASPRALAEVERQAGEYKLFRSLALLFLLDALLSTLLGQCSWRRVTVEAVFSVAAGARFLFLLAWTQRLCFEFFAILTGENRAFPISRVTLDQ